MGKVINGEFKQKVAKKSFQELCEEVVGAINMESHPFPTPWPHKFHVLEPSPGGRLILEESAGGVMSEVPADRLACQITQWLRLMNVPEWCVTDQKALTIAKTWAMSADALPPKMLKSLRWASEPGYCWDRLPWDLGAYGQDCPTWDSLLSRMTNVPAFLAFIGSLFYDQSSLQNYCWVHGDGNDGKGAINRFLAKVFGKSYRSKQPPDRNGKIGNWLYSLIGSRLVVFPDCNNASFAASGPFKAMTGGDPVEFEAKFKMPFTDRLNCKFIFFSNEKPNLSSERADMRRVIYCEFTEQGTYDPAFEDKLWAEGGAFISTCCQLYLNDYPKHGPIQSDTEAIKSLVSENEEHFETFFEANFKEAPEGKRTAQDLHNMTTDALRRVAVFPADFSARLASHFDRRGQSEFRSWLRRTIGVQKVTVTYKDGQQPSKQLKLYAGIMPKDW
jgi:hypothetical protein